MDFEEYIDYFFERLVNKLNSKCVNKKWSINRIYYDESNEFTLDSPCDGGYIFGSSQVCINCYNTLEKYRYEYQKILLLKKLSISN